MEDKWIDPPKRSLEKRPKNYPISGENSFTIHNLEFLPEKNEVKETWQRRKMATPSLTNQDRMSLELKKSIDSSV